MSDFENISVVFDLDGTLVDTARDLLRVLNESIALDGLKPVDYQALKKLVGYGSRALIERAYADARTPLSSERCDAVQKDFLTRYADDIAQLSVPYPGVIEVLTQLKDNGARLSVCTNKPGYLARPLLDALSMTHFFDRIIGSDDTPEKKPAAGHIFHAAGHKGISPIVMVGDSAPDVNAAKAAKAASIVMTYGYSPVPPEKLGADKVLSSFKELPQTILELTP